MTTTTNLYPFTTKTTIKARLATDPDYRQEAIVTLFTKQTEWEQASSQTRDRNKVGFMSSHAVHGSRIAKLLINGEELSEEDTAKLDSIVCHYSRQLAFFARQEAIKANPELAELAKTFSAQ